MHGKKPALDDRRYGSGDGLVSPYHDYDFIGPLRTRLSETLGLADDQFYYPLLGNPVEPSHDLLNTDFNMFVKRQDLRPDRTLFVSYSLSASYMISKCIRLLAVEPGGLSAFSKYPAHIAILPWVTRRDKYAGLMADLGILDLPEFVGQTAAGKRVNGLMPSRDFTERMDHFRNNTLVVCAEGSGDDVDQQEFFGPAGLGLKTLVLPTDVEPKSSQLGDLVVSAIS